MASLMGYLWHFKVTRNTSKSAIRADTIGYKQYIVTVSKKKKKKKEYPPTFPKYINSKKSKARNIGPIKDQHRKLVTNDKENGDVFYRYIQKKKMGLTDETVMLLPMY